MSLFPNKATEREPTLEESAKQREQTLLQEIAKLDKERDALRSATEVFRREHLAFVNGQIVFMTDDLHGRDELARQWSLLCEASADLMKRRDAALHEWSELQSNRGEVTSH